VARAENSRGAFDIMIDPLESALVAGAITALRNRAVALRKRATIGVTVLDRRPVVLVVTSEAAHALRVARDWEAVANEMERSR
jgi:hypothetical protein